MSKKLQQTYTTPEQSKELLEFGLPADSADLVYLRTPDTDYDPFVITDRKPSSYKDALPCWSAGRLIEISIMCGRGEKVPNEMYINSFSLQPSLIENIISRLERVACLDCNDFDFSKLDD